MTTTELIEALQMIADRARGEVEDEANHQQMRDALIAIRYTAENALGERDA